MPRQKVRAERRCGELLARTEKNTGARMNGGGEFPVVARCDHREAPTLADMGLTKNESSRDQQLAAMPAEHFETAVATAKATAGEVTTAFMLREGSPRTNFVRRCDKVCRPCARGLALMGVVSFDSHTPPRAGSPSAECPPTMRGHLSAARAR